MDSDQARLLAIYEAAVDAMPPPVRRVFLMQRVDDLGYGEIASRLGLSIADVEARMMQALAQLSTIADEERWPDRRRYR